MPRWRSRISRTMRPTRGCHPLGGRGSRRLVTGDHRHVRRDPGRQASPCVRPSMPRIWSRSLPRPASPSRRARRSMSPLTFNHPTHCRGASSRGRGFHGRATETRARREASVESLFIEFPAKDQVEVRSEFAPEVADDDVLVKARLSLIEPRHESSPACAACSIRDRIGQLGCAIRFGLDTVWSARFRPRDQVSSSSERAIGSLPGRAISSMPWCPRDRPFVSLPQSPMNRRSGQRWPSRPWSGRTGSRFNSVKPWQSSGSVQLVN